MTYCSVLHPEEKRPGANSSGLLTVWITICHPDDLGQHHKSSGWHPALTISQSDDLLKLYCQDLIRVTYGRCIMSSGWLIWRSHLIRMSNGKFIMSSRWHTPPSYVIRMTYLRLVPLLDELRQCYFVIRMKYASFLKSSGWHSKFRFSPKRGRTSTFP